MEKSVIRFNFKSPVHFGQIEQTPSFTSSDFLLQNDSFFSALVIEANKMYGQAGIDEILDICENKCEFSSMLPCYDDVFLLPKPIVKLDCMHSDKTEKLEMTNYAKAFKKLKFIPANYYNDYISKLKNGVELPINSLNDYMKDYGCVTTNQQVVINRDINQDNLPLHRGAYAYNGEIKAGTYIILKTDSPETLEKIKKLLIALSFDGLGGKKSSGYGKFDFEIISLKNTKNEHLIAIDSLLENNFNRYMTLSICLPNNLTDELLSDAYYSLVRRSGFISSYSYSTSFVKKKDIYAFMCGSTFTDKFEGKILDVSHGDCVHPVYKHLKPLFVGVD